MTPILSLQCMRAVAAILVVIFHHMNTLRESAAPGLPRFDIGEFGVDIFFIISGFIMWTTTAGQRMTGTRFMKRRIVRIVPLYWALTLVTAFVSTAGGLSVSFAVDYVRLVKSLLFIPQWHQTYPMVAPCMNVGWTLELEMLFYAIFACALHLGPARRLGVVVAILGALTAAGLIFAPGVAVLKAYTNDIVLEFGMGMVLGRLHEQGRAPKSSASGVALIATALLFISLRHRLPEVRCLYFGIPALLLMSGVLALESFFEGGVWLPKFLGDTSYSIYLSHMMAMAISAKLVSRSFASSFTWLALVFEVALAIAVGSLVYLLVEKPLTEAGRRLFTRRSAPLRPASRAPS